MIYKTRTNCKTACFDGRLFHGLTRYTTQILHFFSHIKHTILFPLFPFVPVLGVAKSLMLKRAMGAYACLPLRLDLSVLLLPLFLLLVPQLLVQVEELNTLADGLCPHLQHACTHSQHLALKRQPDGAARLASASARSTGRHTSDKHKRETSSLTNTPPTGS